MIRESDKTYKLTRAFTIENRGEALKIGKTINWGIAHYLPMINDYGMSVRMWSPGGYDFSISITDFVTLILPHANFTENCVILKSLL